MSAKHWAQLGIEQRKSWSQSLKHLVDIPSSLRANSQSLNGLLSAAKASDILKDDRTTTVARIEADGQCLVLKRYNARSQWHKVTRAMRISRAHRCWHMSFEFQRADLNVARPVLMLEQRIGPIRTDAFFISELLQGEELLGALPKMDQQQKMQVKKSIADAFKVLRAARISHGDMKATNLLWVNEELFFIDLDAAKKHGFWSLNWRKSHQKDKRRFLKNWADQPELLALFEEL